MCPTSTLAGILYCIREFSSTRPLLSYVMFSVRAIPIPCKMPPSACTRARLGLIGVPQSTAAAKLTTFVSPVNRSISISAAPAIKGGGEIGELWVADASSRISLPHMEAVAMSFRDTLCSPSQITSLPSNSTWSYAQPRSFAPRRHICSRSFMAQFSTAFPVT